MALKPVSCIKPFSFTFFKTVNLIFAMKYILMLLTLLSALLLLCFSPELLFADPPIFPDNPDQVPIDGGLGLLAAAGGAYALNKLRQKKAE